MFGFNSYIHLHFHLFLQDVKKALDECEFALYDVIVNLSSLLFFIIMRTLIRVNSYLRIKVRFSKMYSEEN